MTHIHDDKLHSYADRVKDKVVIITGGGNGIGRDAALDFASHGAKVVIGDLDGAAGQKVVAEIKSAGGTAASIRCNVVVWDDLVALYELAISTYGSVDIVVPNAGVAERGDFETVVFKDGKPVKPKMTTLDVNLNAVLNTVHLAQHYLCVGKKTGDLKAIVLIGSIASWEGIPKGEVYSVSKHAILGLMRALSGPLELSGIRMAVINPFFADTGILDAPLRLILAGIPMVPVSRIAGAIFYAATDPDPATNGSAWLLPDNGPVFLVPREEFKMGVYKMIDERSNALFAGARGFIYYRNIARDVSRILHPIPQLAFLAALSAIAWSYRAQLASLGAPYLS